MAKHPIIEVDRESELGRAIDDAAAQDAVLVIDGRRFRLVAEEAEKHQDADAFRKAVKSIGPLWTEDEADRLKADIYRSREVDIAAADTE